MKITVESTDQVVELVNGQAVMPARVWEGTTDSGVPVVCFITRITPLVRAPVPDSIVEEFARSLQECRSPSPAANDVFDARMIL